MATIVQDCPRCGARLMTFDITSDRAVSKTAAGRPIYEASTVCRRCGRMSLMGLLAKPGHKFENVNGLTKVGMDVGHLVDLTGFVTAADNASKPAPPDLPEELETPFIEGTRCLASGCPNAAGAMFRLCLDIATKSRLPEDSDGAPDKHTRRNLAPRLKWLFDNNGLPEALRALSDAVKANGDDGAHEGSLTAHDAEDIYDFAYALLDRLYSEPARLAAAARRREERRRGT